MSFQPLDPLLHSQLRLAIVSLLIGVDSADFNYLLEQTESTKGNLSTQLSKLKEAGYVDIKKSFKNNYPHTSARITKKGREAFEAYVKALSQYIKQ